MKIDNFKFIKGKYVILLSGLIAFSISGCGKAALNKPGADETAAEITENTENTADIASDTGARAEQPAAESEAENTYVKDKWLISDIDKSVLYLTADGQAGRHIALAEVLSDKELPEVKALAGIDSWRVSVIGVMEDYIFYTYDNAENFYIKAVNVQDSQLQTLFEGRGYIDNIVFKGNQFDAVYHKNTDDEWITKGIKISFEGDSLSEPEKYEIDAEPDLESYVEWPEGQSGYSLTSDENYIIYRTYNTDNYEDIGIFAYSIADDTSSLISEDYLDIISFENGMLYYKCEDRNEEHLKTCSVYCYDMAADKKELLYEAVTSPGIHNIVSGSVGFKIIEDDIYYLADDGADVGWYKKSAGKEAEALGVTVWSSSWAKYGTVKTHFTNEYCDKCGKEIFYQYAEYLELNADIKNADKINAVLAAPYTAMEPESSRFMDEEECEYHGTAMGLESDEVSLSRVAELGGNYLTVDTDSYWYGGGAHGMPDKRHYLFDLETGEEVKLADLYKGSVSDFKELAASAVVADYESYDDDMMPYFPTDTQELYSQIYEKVDFDSLIAYEEEGAYLEFVPYDLGPFSSGFIRVCIPYEKLGIEF